MAAAPPCDLAEIGRASSHWKVKLSFFLTLQLLEAAAWVFASAGEVIWFPAVQTRSKELIMSRTTLQLAAALLLISLSAPASAQDALPEMCGAGGGHMGGSPGMADMAGLTEMQEAYMKGMDKMHPAMMAGVMADDPDVAFVCGMIPHHQGAIDMARVQLQYGKDAWVRDLAQKVIDAQTGEIAEMRKWLVEHAK
jgi:hypothetical protein